MKKKVVIIVCLLGSILIGVSLIIHDISKRNTPEYYSKLSKRNNQNLASYDIYKNEATYLVDVTSKEETVGDADYVFVAKVNSIEETDYRNPVELYDDEGKLLEIVYDPYTRYVINVLENIKGELAINEDLSIYKAGGIDQHQEYVIEFENDELPKVGDTYIFLAYVQEDGSLLVCGENSSEEIEKENSKIVDETNIEEAEEILENDSVVKEYKIAEDNESISNRERSTIDLDTVTK